MSDLAQLKYTPSHEWVRTDGKVVTVGITDHAQKEISDVVFVELPKEGRLIQKKESAMVVESVKAAFDIYAPVSGTIVSVNADLKGKPELVNQSPYEKGWLFKIEMSDPKQLNDLLSLNDYDHVKQSTH